MGEHISLTVNGARHDLDVEPRRLLVQAIREDLDLTDSMNDAVNSLKIVLAADRSIHEKRAVEL